MIWCGWKIEEICHVLVNQFHGNFQSKTLSYRKIKSAFRDVKWCFNASWELKGLNLVDWHYVLMQIPYKSSKPLYSLTCLMRHNFKWEKNNFYNLALYLRFTMIHLWPVSLYNTKNTSLCEIFYVMFDMLLLPNLFRKIHLNKFLLYSIGKNGI